MERLLNDRYRAVLRIPGHVGLWAGMYVAGAYVCFWQLAGAGEAGSLPDVWAMISVVMAATAVYLIDRVKLRDSLIDPADLVAQPVRYAFLTHHTGVLRSTALMMIALAMFLAMSASHYLPIVVGLSVFGVIIYAPGPRGKIPRPKDLLGLKNVCVAVGVVSLAVVATVLIGPLSRVDGEAFWATAQQRVVPVLDAALLLFLRVVIDAAICDIDDAETDRQHGTRTLPNTIGVKPAFWILITARILVGCLILIIGTAPWAVCVTWGITSAISAMGLIPLRHHPLRDWTDASFAVEATLVTLIVTVLI